MGVPDLPKPTPARSTRLAAGVTLLAEALNDAREADADRWEFALTVRELRTAGLAETDLRWLVSHGLAEHAAERITRRTGPRQFFPEPDLAVSERTCFVLTDAGLDFSRAVLPVAVQWPGASSGGADPFATPRWDAAARELTWQGYLVKRFRTPARSQERILDVFEEERWAYRIDDPLEGRPGGDRQQRLHDAVRRLNGNQLESRILFTRDGTGAGVCWRAPPDPAAPPT